MLRRVALKFEADATDATLRPLLPPLRETLRAGLLPEGIDLVPAGNDTKGLPQLWLTATSGWNKETTRMTVRARFSAIPSVGAEPSSPVKEVSSQTIFRDKHRLADSLNQASLALIRDLLLKSQKAKSGNSEPRWVLPPNPSGITRVEGKEMKLEGAVPPLEYPWEARVMRVGGYVSCEVQVDSTGRVVQATVTEGAPSLAETALAYASGLRFQVPPKFRERAPLIFDLSLHYGLPPICKASRIVLEVMDGSLKEPRLQPKGDLVSRTVREMLLREGVQLVEGPSAEDPGLRHLQIQIETLWSRGGLCVYGVRARLSSYSDRNLEVVNPANPLAIVRCGVVAGQRGEGGFQESLLKSVKDVIRATVDPPHPGNPMFEVAPPGLQEADTAELDYSQIKIKRQPPRPPYPEGAHQKRIQGTVVVVIEIDEEGRPTRGLVHQGPPELLMTALQYALEWSFEPAKLNGKAVRARFKLTENFKLR